MDDDVESIKLRRWAIEQLVSTAPVDTTADIAQLCRASDALIAYLLTGAHPRQLVLDNGKDGNGNPPEPNARPN